NGAGSEVGKAAEIEKKRAFGKQQSFSKRDQRGSLSAESDILDTEIRDERTRQMGGHCFPVADLRGETLLGLVENRLPVRGDEVRGQAAVAKEARGCFAKQVAIFAVRPSKFL